MNGSLAIRRSSTPNGMSCDKTILTIISTQERPIVTKKETLSCVFAGQTVTYCVEFNSSNCILQPLIQAVTVKREQSEFFMNMHFVGGAIQGRM